jgi:hypothetical protein
MTEWTPPGRASLAKVTINGAARRSPSRIVEPSDQGDRSAQDCPYAGSHAIIGEFAPERSRPRSALRPSRFAMTPKARLSESMKTDRRPRVASNDARGAPCQAAIGAFGQDDRRSQRGAPPVRRLNGARGLPVPARRGR